jgi:hypothetical protein
MSIACRKGSITGIAGVLLLVGCASGSVAIPDAEHSRTVEPQATARFLAEVYARTDAATSASYVWELRSTTGMGAGKASTVAVMEERGAFDRSRQRFTAETTWVGPDGEVAGAPLRVVADGGALYVQPGYLAEAMGLQPHDWIGSTAPVDGAGDGGGTRDGSSPAGIGPRGIGLGGIEVGALLASLLADATGDVEIIGEEGAERVRGEPTTHLRAHVATLALPDTVAGPGVLDHTGDGVTVDVWVDGEGLLRRVVADAGEITLRVDLFDYEEPVAVEIPEESRIVMSHSELLGEVVTRFGAG